MHTNSCSAICDCQRYQRRDNAHTLMCDTWSPPTCCRRGCPHSIPILILRLVVMEVERKLYLVVVRRLPPMNFGMAWTAQRYEISRIFIEDPFIGQVVNFSRG